MKAKINDEGELWIIPETIFEKAMLENWCDKHALFNSEGKYIQTNGEDIYFDCNLA